MMRKNQHRGMLIAIDGPNGSGKSTIIKKLKKELEQHKYQVYITREPTDSELGAFVREYAEKNTGVALACLVAADRYEHIKNEIIPHLKEGQIVLSDRYVLSSLILQGMDGVDLEFICEINRDILCPDLQIAVFADEEILQKRLLEREMLTRFEKDNQSEREIEYLKKGIEILRGYGVKVFCVENNSQLDNNVETLLNEINKLWEE